MNFQRFIRTPNNDLNYEPRTSLENCLHAIDENDDDKEVCAHRTFCCMDCVWDFEHKFHNYGACPYCILLGGELTEYWDNQREVVERGLKFYEWAIKEGESGKEDFTKTKEYMEAQEKFRRVCRGKVTEIQHPNELFLDLYEKGYAIGSASIKIAKTLKVRAEMMEELFEATGCPPGHWRFPQEVISKNGGPFYRECFEK